MLTKFQDNLSTTNLIPPKSKLLVAVSGGVDSVSLMHLLSQLKDFYGWNISIVHFDHKARPDSNLDAELVAQLAENYDFKYYLGKNYQKGRSEADLRKARYDFMLGLLDDINYDYLMTAHHADDRIETAIFNTIRGSDRHGVTSLAPVRGKIIRPMLPFSKAEIITYAELQDLPYRNDSTNSDINFSRNFVRNILVPQGSMLYRNFHHNFITRLNELSELNLKIDHKLDDILSEISHESGPEAVELDKVIFRGFSEAVATNILVYIMRKLKPGLAASRSTILRSERFLKTAQSGSSMHLKGGLHLEVGYDTLKVTCQPYIEGSNDDMMTHPLRINRPFENKVFDIRQVGAESSHGAVGLKPQKLYVRYRQPGDRIRPVGMRGTKKLQDIFVDKKISKDKRDFWPVVVNQENDILWLPGLAVNRDFVSDGEETIYLKCEVKN
ncbi:MAG: tRNA lysidine(34) synthetase TilS [Candidatus Saccharibacteria bacterium]